MNETKTNTTTPAAVLLLVEDNRAAHHARRIEAAHARHAISTAGTWTDTPAGIRPPIHRQSGEQLTTTADTAARLAIRARHQAAALDLFRQLTNAAHADRTSRNLPAIATEALEAEAQRDKLREAAAEYRKIAARKSTTPAEAKAARAKAEAITKAADKAAAKVESLTRIIAESTASDRADIVQAAIAAAMEYNHTADPNAAFAEMCRAAGRAIAAVASPTALNATRTKVTEITAEEAAELLKIYPNIVTIDPATGYEIETPCKIPHAVKGATSQCFDTIEQRERGRGKDRRIVWCKVSHYLTTAPCVSYEAFTEASGGDVAEIANNGGINAIGTQEDAAAIADLLERANLTERETAIVYRVADQTAARHGQAAAAEYWKERTPQIAALPTKKARREAHKAAQATADNYRIAAQWENAFDRSGVYSKGNRYTIKSRIYARLTKAQHPAEPQTEAERAEQERRQWERLQSNSRRGHATQAAPKVDLVGVVQRAAASMPKHKPVVRWTESGNEPQTLTPAELEAITERERQAAAEYVKAHGANIAFIEYRRQLRTQAARTPWQALNATAAALVFLDHLTTEEQADTMRAIQAERAAHAAERARIAAEARAAAESHAERWNERPAHTITAAQWNAIPAAARLAFLGQIHAAGKRLAFTK